MSEQAKEFKLFHPEPVSREFQMLTFGELSKMEVDGVLHLASTSDLSAVEIDAEVKRMSQAGLESARTIGELVSSRIAELSAANLDGHLSDIVFANNIRFVARALTAIAPPKESLETQCTTELTIALERLNQWDAFVEKFSAQGESINPLALRLIDICNERVVMEYSGLRQMEAKLSGPNDNLAADIYANPSLRTDDALSKGTRSRSFAKASLG